MNQRTTASFDYTVAFDGVLPAGGNPLALAVNAGVAAQYTSVELLTDQSTVLLRLDATGTPSSSASSTHCTAPSTATD